MKNTTLLMTMSLFLAIAGILVFSSSVSSNTNFLGQTITGNAINTGTAQTVKMYVQGGTYIIDGEIKEGVPVRIEADMNRMPGCSRAIVIPAFDVAKNLNSRDNIIEFTPDKAGTFNIMCSMNMYRGTFTVNKADGTKGNYVEEAPTGGSTCSSGGCGCGAR